MRVPIYQVDAFADRRFAGNPAAVVPFERFPGDGLLQAIAAENNLAETAFLAPCDDGWEIRWFTPTVEVPLCGHATLASGWVILEALHPGRPAVRFRTRRAGVLTVRRAAGGFVVDLPVNRPAAVAAPDGLAAVLGAEPREVLATSRQYIAVLETADRVRRLTPDLPAMLGLDRNGVVVTAAGDPAPDRHGYDCVSRYFAPRDGIPEDPVTGGVHCALAPFWCGRLGKPEIRAYQASARGGEMRCRTVGDRVELEGRCVPYLQGWIEVDA